MTPYHGSSTFSARSASFIEKKQDLQRTSRLILALLFCFSLFSPVTQALANGSPLSVRPIAGPLSPNAALVIDTNLDLNLPINSNAVISPALLHASEVGILPVNLVFTLVTNVTQGTLALNSIALSQGSTFTQQDINSGLLSYSAPATISTNGFTFIVADGSQTSDNQTYTIHINKLEPTTLPTNFHAQAISTSEITTSWSDVPAGAAPDGYVVLCSPNGFPAAPVDTSTPISNSCTDGSGSVHIPQGIGTYSWQGLNSETTYQFVIYPYSQTNYTPPPGAFFDYLTSAGTLNASAQTFLTYSISGLVMDVSAAPLVGVLIDAGNGHTAYSGEDGTFTLTGLVPGDYTLSASLPCYSFAPPSISVTVSDMINHVVGENFTGTALSCIRGTVTSSSNPLVGVVISDGSTLSTTTFEGGGYFLVVPPGYNGTLSPHWLDYYFIPDRRVYTNVITDQIDQWYLGTRLSVSWDRFTAAWGGVTGATGYTLDVATDAGFTNFVPGYQDREVGYNLQFLVTGLSPQKHYFFRVRGHDLSQTFGNSIPTEVLTTPAYFFPFVGR